MHQILKEKYQGTEEGVKSVANWQSMLKNARKNKQD